MMSNRPLCASPSTPLLAALLGLLTLAVYWPATTFDFVRFDDQINLTQNPLLHPPSWEHVKTFWKQPYDGLYIPVTYTLWSAFASVARVRDAQGAWELNPYLFHSLNIFIHFLTSILVWRLLLHLVRDRWAAWFGAAFFALHPMSVEAVAWVTGFRDVLSGMLGFAALLAYFPRDANNATPPKAHGPAVGSSLHLSNPHPRHSAAQLRDSHIPTKNTLIATLLFLLAILAKPAAVAILPMALALDLLWFTNLRAANSELFLTPSPGTPGEGRGEGLLSSTSKDPHPLPEYLAREKEQISDARGTKIIGRSMKETSSRLFLWALAATLLVWMTHHWQGAPPPLDTPSWWQRPLIASDAIAFYLGKLIVPLHLCLQYNHAPHHVLAGNEVFLSTAIVIVAGIAIYFLGRRWRLIWLAGALFIAGLLPVLGFVPFGFQQFSTVADRYLYFALFGAGVAVAFILAAYPRRKAYWVASLLLAVLGILSYRQVLTWRSTQTLFAHLMEINPHSDRAALKLSWEKRNEAIYLYQHANPSLP